MRCGGLSREVLVEMAIQPPTSIAVKPLTATIQVGDLSVRLTAPTKTPTAVTKAKNARKLNWYQQRSGVDGG